MESDRYIGLTVVDGLAKITDLNAKALDYVIYPEIRRQMTPEDLEAIAVQRDSLLDAVVDLMVVDIKGVKNETI